MSIATIEVLPDLPMMIIFSHLTMADRIGAEMVCRRWNRLAKNSASWRHFHSFRIVDLAEMMIALQLEKFSEKGLERLVSRFKKWINELEFEFYSPEFLPICESIKYDRLCKAVKWINKKFTIIFMPIVHQQIDGRQIRHLIFGLQLEEYYRAIQKKTTRPLLQIADKLPELRTLIIQGPMMKSDFECLSIFAKHSTKLEMLHIELYEEFIVSEFVFPSTLVNIKIKDSFSNASYSRNASQAYLSKIVEQCPNLKSLETNLNQRKQKEAINLLISRIQHLCSSAHFVNIFAETNCKTFENIRALEIENLSVKQLLLIGQNCPQLEHLTMSMEEFSEAEMLATNFATFGAAFSNLKSALLGNNFKIFFPLIVNGNFCQLKWLHMDNRDTFELNEIVVLLDNCPNLCYFRAFSLSNEAISEVVKRSRQQHFNQLRIDISMENSQFVRISNILENAYPAIGDTEKQQGIVRIYCNIQVPATRKRKLNNDLHPLLVASINKWPEVEIPESLRETKFGELSEIPTFLKKTLVNLKD